MSYQVSDIVSDVQKTIDEIALNDAEFVGGNDNAEMVEIIKSKIVDAATYIVEHAESAYIEPDETITTGGNMVSVKDASDVVICNIVQIALSKRLLRMQKAKCGSWPYYVTEAIRWDDKEYSKLRDKYTTGTHQRPKVGFVRGASGDVLELYCPKDYNDTYEVSVSYYPSMTDDQINVPSGLRSALVYYTAGLTLLTYGDQRADDMFNQAMAMMGVNPNATQSQS